MAKYFYIILTIAPSHLKIYNNAPENQQINSGSVTLTERKGKKEVQEVRSSTLEPGKVVFASGMSRCWTMICIQKWSWSSGVGLLNEYNSAFRSIIYQWQRLNYFLCCKDNCCFLTKYLGFRLASHLVWRIDWKFSSNLT